MLWDVFELLSSLISKELIRDKDYTYALQTHQD